MSTMPISIANGWIPPISSRHLSLLPRSSNLAVSFSLAVRISSFNLSFTSLPKLAFTSFVDFISESRCFFVLLLHVSCSGLLLVDRSVFLILVLGVYSLPNTVPAGCKSPLGYVNRWYPSSNSRSLKYCCSRSTCWRISCFVWGLGFVSRIHVCNGFLTFFES
jgi:hypothetical protein